MCRYNLLQGAGTGDINQVGIGDKSLEVVQDQHFIVAFLLNGGVQPILKVAEIHHADLAIVGGQVGDNGSLPSGIYF